MRSALFRVSTNLKTAAVFLGLVWSSAALAEPKDDARRHFLAGLEFAQAGEYDRALERFLVAQEAYPHPNTLYNIARAYFDMGSYEEALGYFLRFQQMAPDRAASVQEAVDNLRERLRPLEPAPRTVIIRRPVPTDPAVRPRPRVVAPDGQTEPTTEPAPDPQADIRIEAGTDPAIDALAWEVRRLTELVQSITEDRAETGDPSEIGEPSETSDPSETGDPTETGDPSESGDPAETGDPSETGDPPTVRQTDRSNEDPPELGLGEVGFISEGYERIIVTASRYGQDPLDSPTAVSIITRDTIQLSGATNVPDLLRRAAGVDVMAMTSGSPSVSIRGFNSELPNKVLVLIDGRSTYWDFIGAPFWANFPISLDEIERIEVIRGPGSAMYGANAMTGVINIITTNPAEKGSPDDHRNIMRSSYGYPNFISASGTTTGSMARGGYRFSASYLQEGRWAKDVELTEDTSAVPLFEDQNLGIRTIRGNGRIDQTFADLGFVSLSAGFTTGQWEFFNIGALKDYAIRETHNYVRADVSYGPVHFRSFWNRDIGATGPWLEAKNTARPLTSPVVNDVVDTEIEANGEFDTGPVTHRMHGGVGYRYKRIQFELLEGGADTAFFESHFGAFFSEELSYKWLRILVSVRLDRHPLLPLDKTFSPRGAFVFRVSPKTAVRVSGGMAYRAPNHVESYTKFNLNTSVDGLYVEELAGQTDPNVNLIPERIISAELGVHDNSSVWHDVDVALYFNRVTDLITLRSVDLSLNGYNNDGRGYAIGDTGFANDSDTVYYGFGGELDAAVYPVDGLDFWTNLSVSRVLEQDAEGELVPEESASLIKLNAGTSWRTQWTSLSIAGHFSSAQTWRLREFDEQGQVQLNEQSLPPRFLMSLRLAVHPFKDPHIELAGTVWNPIGYFEPFREHPNGHPTGARLFGTLTYKF